MNSEEQIKVLEDLISQHLTPSIKIPTLKYQMDFMVEKVIIKISLN